MAFYFLEAFFLSNGVLAIATAYKKEFFVTKCDEFPFDDGQWHSLAICQVKPVYMLACWIQRLH